MEPSEQHWQEVCITLVVILRLKNKVDGMLGCIYTSEIFQYIILQLRKKKDIT